MKRPHIKIMSLVLVILFAWNNITWANPDFVSRSNLIPILRSTKHDFKKKWKAASVSRFVEGLDQSLRSKLNIDTIRDKLTDISKHYKGVFTALLSNDIFICIPEENAIIRYFVADKTESNIPPKLPNLNITNLRTVEVNGEGLHKQVIYLEPKEARPETGGNIIRFPEAEERLAAGAVSRPGSEIPHVLVEVMEEAQASKKEGDQCSDFAFRIVNMLLDKGIVAFVHTLGSHFYVVAYIDRAYVMDGYPQGMGIEKQTMLERTGNPEYVIAPLDMLEDFYNGPTLSNEEFMARNRGKGYTRICPIVTGNENSKPLSPKIPHALVEVMEEAQRSATPEFSGIHYAFEIINILREKGIKALVYARHDIAQYYVVVDMSGDKYVMDGDPRNAGNEVQPVLKRLGDPEYIIAPLSLIDNFYNGAPVHKEIFKSYDRLLKEERDARRSEGAGAVDAAREDGKKIDTVIEAVQAWEKKGSDKALRDLIYERGVSYAIPTIQTIGVVGGDRASSVLKGIYGRLSRKNPYVTEAERDLARQALIEAIGNTGSPDAMYFLLKLIRGRAKFAKDAVKALADPRYSADETMQALQRFLDSDDFWMKHNAIYALGHIGDPIVLDDLTELMDDENEEIQAVSRIAVDNIKRGVKEFMKDAPRVLTKKQEQILFKALEAENYPGSERLEEDIETFLIEKNMGLIVSMAKRFSGNRKDVFENARADGMLSILAAIRKFEWRKGYKFSTYAIYWLRTAMTRGKHLLEQTIHIPERVITELSALNSARESLLQRLDREPTEKEIAGEMKVSVEKVKRLLDASQPQPLSLDFKAGHTEDSATLGDFISGEKGVYYEDLSGVFPYLTYRQRIIIKLRNGIGTDKGRYTQQEVADIFKVARTGIGQIEQDAMRKLYGVLKHDVKARLLTPGEDDNTDVFIAEILKITPDHPDFETFLRKGKKAITREIERLGISPEEYIKSKTIIEPLSKKTGIPAEEITDDLIHALPLAYWRVLCYLLALGVPKMRPEEMLKRLRKEGFNYQYPASLRNIKRKALKILKRAVTGRELLAQKIGVAPEQITDEVMKALPERLREVLCVEYGIGRHRVKLGIDGGNEFIARHLAGLGHRPPGREFYSNIAIQDLKYKAQEYLSMLLSAKEGRIVPAQYRHLKASSQIYRYREENLSASGKDLLAEHLGLSPWIITEERLRILPEHWRFVIEASYGINREPLPDYKSIAGQLYERGFRSPRTKGAITPKRVRDIRGEAVALLKQYKNGLDMLSDKLGVDTDTIIERSNLLSILEWNAIRYVYGIGVQRKASDGDIIEALKQGKFDGVGKLVDGEIKLSDVLATARKRLKGKIGYSEHAMAKIARPKKRSLPPKDESAGAVNVMEEPTRSNRRGSTDAVAGAVAALPEFMLLLATTAASVPDANFLENLLPLLMRLPVDIIFIFFISQYAKRISRQEYLKVKNRWFIFAKLFASVLAISLIINMLIPGHIVGYYLLIILTCMKKACEVGVFFEIINVATKFDLFLLLESLFIPYKNVNKEIHNTKESIDTLVGQIRYMMGKIENEDKENQDLNTLKSHLHDLYTNKSKIYDMINPPKNWFPFEPEQPDRINIFFKHISAKYKFLAQMPEISDSITSAKGFLRQLEEKTDTTETGQMAGGESAGAVAVTEVRGQKTEDRKEKFVGPDTPYIEKWEQSPFGNSPHFSLTEIEDDAAQATFAINLHINAARAPGKTVILIPKSLIPASQQKLAGAIERASRKSISSERIMFIEDDLLVDKINELVANGFSVKVGLSKKDQVDLLPDDPEKVKAIIFEKPGEIISFVRIDIIIATLRALGIEDSTERNMILLRLNKLITGKDKIEIFNGFFVIRLPDARAMSINDIEQENERMLELLLAA